MAAYPVLECATEISDLGKALDRLVGTLKGQQNKQRTRKLCELFVELEKEFEAREDELNFAIMGVPLLPPERPAKVARSAARATVDVARRRERK